MCLARVADSTTIRLISESMRTAVSSLKSLARATSRPRKMCSSPLPKVSGPIRSDMPHSQTILRAMSVAFSRSSPAPVVCCWNTISSAARPPSRIVMRLIR